MAERLPVGAARNIKSPSFTSLALPNPSIDVPNASLDHLNGRITSEGSVTIGLNSQILSNSSSANTIRTSGHNKQGHLETTARNLSRTKEGESNHEAEWVEQDEPGVYITLTSLPGGIKDLKRVRFRCVVFRESNCLNQSHSFLC